MVPNKAANFYKGCGVVGIGNELANAVTGDAVYLVKR
jgi:hypothetical protein